MFWLIWFFIVIAFIFWLRYVQSVPQRSTRGSAALVTGCDTGIGHLVAQQLAKNGVTVFAGCLTEKGMQAVTSESEEYNLTSNLKPFLMDVTKDDSVSHALEFVEKHLPEDTLNFSLINNAGIHRGFFVEMTPMDDYRSTMEVNFFGVVNVTKTFLPLLRKYKGTGTRVITITSIAGRVANFGMSTYAASKFASEAFMDALRLELAPFHIPVIIIEPSFSLTPLVQSISSVVESSLEKTPDSILNVYGGRESFLRKARRWCKRVYLSTFPVEDIVHTIIEAYGAIYPKHRYPVGLLAWVLVFIVNLPTELCDKLLLMTWK